jgi:hypothetical protein
MSCATIDPDAVAPEVVAGIRVLPILHERPELAAVVREVLDSVQPAAVAVELPSGLAEAVRGAVARLPAVSVVIAGDEGDDRPLVWPVTPGDPLVEAARWALDRGRDLRLVDANRPYDGRHWDAVPDPHALWTIGVEGWYDAVRRLAAEAPSSDADRLREHTMAHRIKAAAASCHGPVVAVVGATHAAGLEQALRTPTAEPFDRPHAGSVMVRNLHPESLTALLPEMPVVHAAWELMRDGVVPERVPLGSTVAPRVEVELGALRLVGGAAPETRRSRVEDLARSVASRCHRTLGRRPAIDRERVIHHLWDLATASWAEQAGESAARWQRRVFLDFARRQARLAGNLVPRLFEIVVAARGVADDNLAWEVFDAARTYPWQREEAEIATARIDGDRLDLGTRTIRFRRRFFRTKRRLVSVPVKEHPAPTDPAEWLEGFTGEGLCSYPPEDIVVEGWGDRLKAKAVRELAAEHSHSEPFTTSMLDGIDLRETLLRFNDDRIWVRERGRAPGDASSLVVVFDDDGSNYPYLMSWLGEHEQESDMAFYATDPLRQVVGPGILRATYGGFMLTSPPRRLADPWQDPDYRVARSKAEVLLMAAVDYSVDKVVVHVGPRPPAERLKRWASAKGRVIHHIPLGSLSPRTVRNVRVVHILSGYETREHAGKYIW